ncbi:hypothetical protein F7734_06525 [Scytonema sp. UIC 10036]|uniref:hypothetical protein n=1 Tax=Scytonema sp. UIC 10036 TaxID=2304196 RepID=UPI0012DAD0DA|nr:hypothetical protein [Scytonema sp. UIC 10036]MUG92131.1 hypothetical protein [Scytonema sp. UIC 10036]
MILRSYTLGLASVAITLISFGLDTTKANAQTNYEFSATYDTVVTIDPSFRPDIGITRATITGESADAPYGLSKFLSNTYGSFDPTTNISYFNADASAFGLENQPLLGDRYYGGSNELFGTANDQAKFDFVNGTVEGGGTITLTGGEGIFKDAVGKITFTQNDRLTSTDLTAPFKGKAVLKFSLQTPKAIPEPNTTAGVIGMGFVGLSVFLGKYTRKLKFRG